MNEPTTNPASDPRKRISDALIGAASVLAQSESGPVVATGHLDDFTEAVLRVVHSGPEPQVNAVPPVGEASRGCTEPDHACGSCGDCIYDHPGEGGCRAAAPVIPVHAFPPDGSGITPCCGRTPFELPRSELMTSVPDRVTCTAKADRIKASRGTRLCHDTDPDTLKECALGWLHDGDHADANTRWPHDLGVKRWDASEHPADGRKQQYADAIAHALAPVMSRADHRESGARAAAQAVMSIADQEAQNAASYERCINADLRVESRTRGDKLEALEAERDELHTALGLASGQLHSAALSAIRGRGTNILELTKRAKTAELAERQTARLSHRYRDEAERLRRERDLAVAHDRQPYPTAWAYEQACKALEKHRQRADTAESAIENVRKLAADLDNPTWRAPGTEVAGRIRLALDGDRSGCCDCPHEMEI